MKKKIIVAVVVVVVIFGGDRDYLCSGTDTGADLTGKEAGQRL